MPTAGPACQKRKLSDDVRARLLAMIEGGRTRPGDLLPSERELMEQLGVGRPVIREAMQALEQAGLIEIGMANAREWPSRRWAGWSIRCRSR